MKLNILSSLFFISYLILLSACSTPPSSASQVTSEVQISEQDSQTITSTETIRLNNCGGKGDSEQISERSFAVNIEGGLEIQGGIEYVEGKISGKYGQYRNYSKSLKVIAPPSTNMEFEIKWTELEWTGTLTANGQSGKYNVHAPIEVELVSSLDKGECDNTNIVPAQPTPSTVPT